MRDPRIPWRSRRSERFGDPWFRDNSNMVLSIRLGLTIHQSLRDQRRPTARRPARTSQDEQRSFWTLYHHRRCQIEFVSWYRLFFNMMLKQATEVLDDDDTVSICLTPRDCSPAQKTLEPLFGDLLFVDDAPLAAHTRGTLLRLTSCFAEASQLFELEVSLKKTEVLHQPVPREAYRPPHIIIDETGLKAVHQFWVVQFYVFWVGEFFTLCCWEWASSMWFPIMPCLGLNPEFLGACTVLSNTLIICAMPVDSVKVNL